MTLRERLQKYEWEIIRRALADHAGNITETALALGVPRSHLQRKLRERVDWERVVWQMIADEPTAIIPALHEQVENARVR